MITKTKYKKLTGEIEQISSGPEGIVLFEDTLDYGWVDGEWDNNYYITAGPTITLRPTLPELENTSGNIWSKDTYPASTYAEVWDTELDLLLDTVYESSGIITIELPDSGVYLIKLFNSFPYKNTQQTIEVS